MPLPTGQISMSEVNTELGFSSTATITLNDSGVRGLASVPSGAISMANLQGKSGSVAVSFTYTTNSVSPSLDVSTIGGYSAGKTAVTVTINSGVYLYSTSASPAFSLSGGTSGDVLTLVNNGFIAGQGGQGGNANTPVSGGSPVPTAGQVGLSISTRPWIITNNGYIGGGGGGGGGTVAVAGAGGGGAGGGRGGSVSPAIVGGTGGYTGNSGTPGGPGSPGAGGGAGGGGGLAGAQALPSPIGPRPVPRPNPGGGGGGIFPGVGGAGAANQGTIGGGGGAGGSANGAGGNGVPNVTFASTVGGGGGGGGWGAVGGNNVQNAGAAGGKAVNLNGQSVTWPAGTSTVYGTVS